MAVAIMLTDAEADALSAAAARVPGLDQADGAVQLLAGLALRDEEAVVMLLLSAQDRLATRQHPGDYRQARGVIPWHEGDEPSEVIIRRLRGGDGD